MEVLTFRGTPLEIGQAFGESCRGEIPALYEARVLNAIDQAKRHGGRQAGEADVLAIAERSLPIVRARYAIGYEELTGIAEGSGLPVAKIWAMNALTDLRDVLAFGKGEPEGCTAFVVQRDRAANGHGFLGQTWDLATDNMPYVRIVRRDVEGGPSTASLTLVGCLSLIGMNEHGLAIGTTNLRTRDARPGVSYLDVIHDFLGRRELESGARAVVNAERAGAHFYFAMDGEGGAVAIECSAQQAVRIDVDHGTYVHTNHVLEPAIAALEAPVPYASSRCRASRMADLLAGPLTPEQGMGFFADHEAGDLSICRHDFDGITSNGAVVMVPAERKIWAIHGPPCQGEWIDVTIP